MEAGSHNYVLKAVARSFSLLIVRLLQYLMDEAGVGCRKWAGPSWNRVSQGGITHGTVLAHTHLVIGYASWPIEPMSASAHSPLSRLLKVSSTLVKSHSWPIRRGTMNALGSEDWICSRPSLKSVCRYGLRSGSPVSV